MKLNWEDDIPKIWEIIQSCSKPPTSLLITISPLFIHNYIITNHYKSCSSHHEIKHIRITGRSDSQRFPWDDPHGTHGTWTLITSSKVMPSLSSVPPCRPGRAAHALLSGVITCDTLWLTETRTGKAIGKWEHHRTTIGKWRFTFWYMWTKHYGRSPGFCSGNQLFLWPISIANR